MALKKKVKSGAETTGDLGVALQISNMRMMATLVTEHKCENCGICRTAAIAAVKFSLLAVELASRDKGIR